MFIKKITKLVLSGMLLGAVVVAPSGCDKGGGGSADLTPPAAPEYESAFDELKDVPAQIDVQIKWITQPIDDAHKLGDEFNALKESLAISAEDLGAMASASFSNGKVEVSADLSIADDKKAELEAFLGKVKQAGADVAAIPKRAQKVAGYLSKMPMKIPPLGAKAVKELKAKLEAAAEDAKAEITANIEMVPTLQTDIIAKSKASIGDVKAIPGEAKDKIVELTAAFSGKGEFKASAGGDEGGGDEGLGEDDGLGEEGGDDLGEEGGDEAGDEGGEDEGGEEAAE